MLLTYTTSFQAINKFIGGLPLWFKRGRPHNSFIVSFLVCLLPDFLLTH